MLICVYMLIHFHHIRLFAILSDGELILSQSSFYTFSHTLSLCVSLSVCDTIFCSVAYFSIVTYYCCLVTKLLFVQSLKSSDTFVTLWTVTCQAPQSMGFPRQEYWSSLLFASPGDLPNPGIEPESPALAGRFFTTELQGGPIVTYCSKLKKKKFDF